MKVKIIASTKINYIAAKEEFDDFSGKAAGICYMPGSFEDLVNEDPAKTQRRVLQTKQNQHHSVYDHEQVSLFIDGIPKILAMFINNEKMYTTSEKSARYTKMSMSSECELLYDNWVEIFTKLIKEKYQASYPKFFDDKRIHKLAQENARYLTSVFTPTPMIYSTTYRQLNILYNFLQRFVSKEGKTDFEIKLISAMKDLMHGFESTPYLDEMLAANNKNREFSLMTRDDEPMLTEYFGDVYATTYKGSFEHLAQALRHRTLSYNMHLLPKPEFYVPPILSQHKELVEKWLNDCNSQVKQYPQGMLVSIDEKGTYENFILKMKERKCTFAQLEINNQTDATLSKYIDALETNHHPKAERLKLYAKGSRCTFPDYKCPSPCMFKDGVNGSREI